MTAGLTEVGPGTTSANVRAASWKALGDLWLGRGSGGVHLLGADGDTVRLTGVLADSLWDEHYDDPLLHAAALRSPLLAQALAAVKHGQTCVLDRASLLRGTGFHTLFVELTAQCNERCVHCYADAAPERHEKLPWSTIAALLSDAAALGFVRVQFTGGDPLLADTLPAAVARARQLGIAHVEIFTNGLALTAALLTELRPHRPTFAFSVYAADAQRHDAITRVPGSHARTLAAMRSCLAHGLGVRAGCTLTAHTLDQREPLRAQLLELGVAPGDIGFVTSHAVGRGEFVAGHNDLDQHGGEATLGGGKACVTAAGDVVPCIFARSKRLGRIADAGLASILTAPEPLQAPDELNAALAEARERLSCADCRLRDVLLPEPLVQLRRVP